MDTRSKILSMDDALELRETVRAVVGYFDPLLAAHVRRLKELATSGTRLMAIVVNPAAPLLNLRARAELAAGLSMIDFVVPVEGDVEMFLARLAPVEIVRDEKDDELRTAQLIEHVQRRYDAR